MSVTNTVLMFGGQITWEESEKYLVLRHFDEHYDNGNVHLIQIVSCGTMIELMDESPSQSHRAYLRSGLSNAVLSFEQFPVWFDWFTEEMLYDESFEVEVQCTDDELVALLDEAGIEYSGMQNI